MNTLNFVLEKYNIDPNTDPPIQIPHKRDELTRLFKELEYKVGAEIGVDRGLYAEELCKANPGVKLFCIDPWKVYKDYEDMQDSHYMNINYAHTKKRLAPYNCEIIKKSSMGAIKDFAPESLDFVYIDGNHKYKYVLEDIEKWSKIVKPDGIVSGHDYIWRSLGHKKYDVKNAVDLYVKENNKTFFLLNPSSWMFIK